MSNKMHNYYLEVKKMENARQELPLHEMLKKTVSRVQGSDTKVYLGLYKFNTIFFDFTTHTYEVYHSYVLCTKKPIIQGDRVEYDSKTLLMGGSMPSDIYGKMRIEIQEAVKFGESEGELIEGSKFDFPKIYRLR